MDGGGGGGGGGGAGGSQKRPTHAHPGVPMQQCFLFGDVAMKAQEVCA